MHQRRPGQGHGLVHRGQARREPGADSRHKHLRRRGHRAQGLELRQGQAGPRSAPRHSVAQVLGAGPLRLELDHRTIHEDVVLHPVTEGVRDRLGAPYALRVIPPQDA
ncbi:MAG: hypothetical protein ACI9MC_001748 [Kiritimatiellia bacterium]|jgi:hypothetical protein